MPAQFRVITERNLTLFVNDDNINAKLNSGEGVLELIKPCIKEQTYFKLKNNSDLKVVLAFGVVMTRQKEIISTALKLRNGEKLNLSKEEVDALLAYAKTIRFDFRGEPMTDIIAFDYYFMKLK